jgi:hypothetical protein
MESGIPLERMVLCVVTSHNPGFTCKGSAQDWAIPAHNNNPINILI